MKKIPKKVIDILNKRAKAAEEFIRRDTELVEWMIENGVDIAHYELKDHIQCGCSSIIDSRGSNDAIIHFLERW